MPTQGAAKSPAGREVFHMGIPLDPVFETLPTRTLPTFLEEQIAIPNAFFLDGGPRVIWPLITCFRLRLTRSEVTEIWTNCHPDDASGL